MAERRRHKKRIQEVSEPTKEEKAVAKYLRFNCPTKSTNMMGHRVDYFIGQCSASALHRFLRHGRLFRTADLSKNAVLGWPLFALRQSSFFCHTAFIFASFCDTAD
uniref:Translocation protein SEC62 n=1 Tax=Fundulus heteroclitus TaxID=8078 RepID=A0A3Q2P9M1_FUNHE